MSFNFDRVLSKLFRGNFLGKLLGVDVSNGLEGYFNKETGAGMTPADREAADLQLSHQQTLNEEDFERKVDFYERFESPEAQVQQYKNAGLNPMLIAGNGSVSASGGVGAGSASVPSPSSGDFSGILSSILSFATRQQEVKNNRDLKQQEIDIERERMRSQVELFRAQTADFEEQAFGRRISNKFAERREQESLTSIVLSNSKTKWESDLIKENIELVKQNTEFQKVYNEFARPLFQSQIRERNANADLSFARKQEVWKLIAKHDAEISQIDALTRKIENEAKYVLTLDEAQKQGIEESKKRIEKYNAEIRKLGADAGLSEKDLQYYIWNHPREKRYPFGFNSYNYSFSGQPFSFTF